jgi:hypothetical protein
MAAGDRDSAKISKENTSTSVIDTLAFSIEQPYNGFKDGRRPEDEG